MIHQPTNTAVKYAAAAILMLTISFSAISQAEASGMKRPGSMCSFERQGTGGMIDKQQGAIDTSAESGTIVTCPLPITTSGTPESHTTRTVVVDLFRDRAERARCEVEWYQVVGDSIQSRDTEVQRASNDTRRHLMRFIDIELPTNAWTVLRCHLPRGSSIIAYHVTADA